MRTLFVLLLCLLALQQTGAELATLDEYDQSWAAEKKHRFLWDKVT